MKRLKQSEVSKTRAELLKQQGSCCAICGRECIASEAVLDHCHKGGYIRAVLHRGCNAMLGKIENSMKLNKLDIETLKNFLDNVHSYIVKHESNQTNIMHYTYKTEEEKRLKRNKKARERNAKLKANIKKC